MFNQMTAGDIMNEIAKGRFTPNVVLTNMAMAYFQRQEDYVARRMFPIVPVPLSTSAYYVFSKGDLARDDFSRKPAGGRVAPTQVSSQIETYRVDVDQIILPIDQIAQTDVRRQPVPGASNISNSKTRIIAEKASIHQDITWANGFFRSGVWTDEWTGQNTASESAQEFIKFSDANCDPIKLFKNFRTRMKKRGRRTPNKLALGENAFNALSENPLLIERVKYSGSSANPATVNLRALAELLGVAEVSVVGSTYNKASLGQEDDMDFICDPDSALLVYATDSPAIDEPSAGYMFTWDMLGDGNWMPVFQYPGEQGTHTEFVEGMMAFTAKKTSDDLGIFMKNCV